jgi:hypothetical protein
MSELGLIWEPWPAQANPGLVWSPPLPRSLTAEDVREWEEDHGVRLPTILAPALLAQNGGRVHGTELVIDPPDDFATLDEEPFAEVFADGPLNALARDKLVHIGEAVGCGIVLHCTVGPAQDNRIVVRCRATPVARIDYPW